MANESESEVSEPRPPPVHVAQASIATSIATTISLPKAWLPELRIEISCPRCGYRTCQYGPDAFAQVVDFVNAHRCY